MAILLARRPEISQYQISQYRAERSRANAVSEFYHYEDVGCEASDSCLDCPLPKCRYDDPAWYQRNRRLAQDFRMLYVIQQESLGIQEAAERFSVTVRTVFRIMQRCREAMMQDGVSGETEFLAA